jgi:hydrocephalus-inducing protein
MNSLELPLVKLSGLSRRPLCHFNIPMSEYLTKRHPEFSYRLPEGTRAVELYANELREKTTKRIEMINPTSKAYEGRWAVVSDNSEGSIVCDNPTVVVSSGKRYVFMFSFCPVSPKIVESLWEFTVGDQELKVHFLFVGRLNR